MRLYNINKDKNNITEVVLMNFGEYIREMRNVSR
jgi:hypothetical protein